MNTTDVYHAARADRILREYAARQLAAEWADIPGRGRLALIAELPPAYHDPAQLVGQGVFIDGQPYRVRGAEKHAVPVSPESPHRGAFGLLVEPVELG